MLHIETLYVSEDLRDDIADNPICTIDPEPVELTFKNGRHQSAFNST